MLGSYLVMVHPVRSSVSEVVCGTSQPSGALSTALTLVIATLVSLLAVLVPDIAVIFKVVRAAPSVWQRSFHTPALRALWRREVAQRSA